VSLLRIEDLTVRYGGVTAVDRVSLEVEAGSFVGLIGPNGAGKTTLIDAVSGLTQASGRMWFDGSRIDGEAPHRRCRRGLRRTFQSLELFEELSVRENLLVAAERPRWWTLLTDLCWPRAAGYAVDAVDESLALLGLTPHADLRPTELSLGLRKLVTIARELSARPRLLLLDEPAAGLDSAESLALGERLRDVVRDGTSILLIDHDMGLVLGVCDQIHVLEFGRRIASGTPREIREDPDVVAAYLGGAERSHADAVASGGAA
jgi:ABC-type branched-subunit amino acid transport system ATPase component